MSGRAGLGGSSTGAPANGANTRADAFEIGSVFLFAAVVTLPCVIVGGIYITYLVFR